MHYQLGADETQAAGLFVRLVAPTEVQKISARMAQIIKGYYAGVDWLNAYLWRILGVSTLEGPLIDFLTNMIALERERRDSLNEATAGEYKATLRARHGYDVDQVVDYVRAYLQCMKEGLVVQAIQEPWTYTPTTIAQDVGGVATGTVKALTPLLLGAVAVYAFVSVFLPNLLGAITRPRHS